MTTILASNKTLSIDAQSYEWRDLEAQLPRELADLVDARDYDNPAQWWDAYIKADVDDDYNADWLLSIIPVTRTSITLAADTNEAPAFAAWLVQRGYDVEIGNAVGYLGNRIDDCQIPESARELFGGLWDQYCDDKPAHIGGADDCYFCQVQS